MSLTIKNKADFLEKNAKLVNGECPVCGKIYVYKRAIWSHIGTLHSEFNESYTTALLKWGETC